MRFQAGDIVRIASNCVYIRNGGCDDNPKDTDGRIREINHYVITVDWPNGEMNEYDEEDLRLRCRAAIPEYNPRVGENPFPRIGGYTYSLANWGTTLQRGTQVTVDDVWG